MLMHSDTARPEDGNAWGPYLEGLRASGRFDGGSSLGPGRTVRAQGDPGDSADHIVGYLFVQAEDIDAARAFLPGNPVYEAGGTVEFRELVED